MTRMRCAAAICAAALATGLGAGFVASSGGEDAGASLRPAGVTLERLAAPAVGPVDVPALVLPRSRTPTRSVPVVTPPPPVTPPPVVVAPPVAPPPPPPPPPPTGPDVTRR